MACAGKKTPAANQLVSKIGLASAKTEPTKKTEATKSRRRSQPVVQPKIDFHCEICGHTGPHKEHTCKGKREVGYQFDRLAICSRCQYQEGEVCTLYKSQHPDRDCVISVGAEMPEAHCPAGLWDRVLFKCDKCKSVSFNEGGIGSCPHCNASKSRSLSMPFKFVDHKEPPLEATSDLLVITIATGQNALDVLEITGPAMQAYAEKCGADFHVIRDNLYQRYPIGNKFRLKNLTKNHKRILFLDSDVWVRSTAANIFDKVPFGTVGIHKDLAFLTKQEWIKGESELVATEQQIELVPLKILNTGVVVFDAVHADIWTHPPLPAKPRHLTEQSWVECNLMRSGYPVTFIDTPFNTQYWFPNFAELEPQAQFVHLANAEHNHRIYQFRKYQFEERQARNATAV